MLENTEGTITNGQSREIGNIGYARHNTKTNKQNHNANMCGIPLCANKQHK